MIIGSFNIRGGGSVLKRKRISKIIKEGRADIFLIQESQMDSVELADVLISRVTKR